MILKKYIMDTKNNKENVVVGGVIYPWNMVHFSMKGNGDRGRTPLHHAARECAVDTVVSLIWAGHDVNKKDDAGFTPLMHALESKDYSGAELASIYKSRCKLWTVHTLLEAGASLEGTESISKDCYSEEVHTLLEQYTKG